MLPWKKALVAKVVAAASLKSPEEEEEATDTVGWARPTFGRRRRRRGPTGQIGRMTFRHFSTVEAA